MHRPSHVPSGVSVGSPVEIGQFGRMSYWVGNEPHDHERRPLEPRNLGGELLYLPVTEGGVCHLGIEWDWPRHVHRVEVEYASPSGVPAESAVRLEYWHSTWPAENRGHWTQVDDAWNGRWVRANVEPSREGATVSYKFDPLDITELRKAEDFAVSYRKTLKIRLVFRNGAPAVRALRVYSDSVWTKTEAVATFGGGAERVTANLNTGATRNVAAVGMASPDTRADASAGAVGGASTPWASAFNGYVERCEWRDNSLHMSIWYTSDGSGGDVTAAGTYPDHDFAGRWPYDGGSPDRTVVTVHGPNDVTVSFLPGDVAAGQVIRVPDLGVTIQPVGNRAEKERYGVASVLHSGTGGRSIFDMIGNEPEQSFERASNEIPALEKTKQGAWGRYVCLACDGNRQEFALRFNGHVYLDKRQLKVNRRDTARLLWPGPQIRYRFGTGDPPDFREREDGTSQRLLDGYLPIVISEWVDRGIAFEQTAFAALIDEGPWNEAEKRGDEASILLLRFVIRNTTPEVRPARLWFVVEPGEYLVEEGGLVKAVGRFVPDNTVDFGWRRHPYAKPRLRAQVVTHGKGSLTATVIESDEAIAIQAPMVSHRVRPRHGAVVYEVELMGHEKHAIEIKIPFETYTDEADFARVQAVDYDAKFEEIAAYWRGMVASGAKLDIPEEIISDFQKAVLTHIAITADKDVESGLYVVPAATYAYNVCGNEACMQIHMLDLLGHHERARAYLETFLKCQGTRPLHGKFKSQEGVFHGLRVSDDFDYQTFNYNLDHGWVMYTCAQHYRLTGDRQWLEKWADNLVAAADFVTRERRATMREENGERVWEYGLLPAGHLEDNPEWFYWYSVNGYTWRGMQAVGEVLAEIGHPEAGRILADAAAYKKDIRAAVRRSMRLAPVVPLRDGTYVPHVPTRAYLRGRDVGWIRENLYGSMHLIETGIFDDNSQEAEWILKDYEDNLFVNPAYGRFVDVEKDWFSQGGITIQAHLMYNCLIYLRRDQIKHALRAYYNALVSHLYPDVRCFSEHAIRKLGWGVGPFYKTPDEAASVTWLRHLLVHEQGDQLKLAWGTPRKWLEHGKAVGVDRAPTYFGPVSYTIASRVGDGVIEVSLVPPARRPPREILVRLRHPEERRISSVHVQGAVRHEVIPDKECIVLRECEGSVGLVVSYDGGSGAPA